MIAFIDRKSFCKSKPHFARTNTPFTHIYTCRQTQLIYGHSEGCQRRLFLFEGRIPKRSTRGVETKARLSTCRSTGCHWNLKSLWLVS